MSKITVRHTDGSISVIEGNYRIGYFDNDPVLEVRGDSDNPHDKIAWFHPDHWISVIVERDDVFTSATNAVAAGS